MVNPAKLGKNVLKIPRLMVKERWYVVVKVGQKSGDFLVDHGATTTLVSKGFYDSLPQKPPMVPSHMVCEVGNGETITTHGCALFPYEIRM